MSLRLSEQPASRGPSDATRDGICGGKAAGEGGEGPKASREGRAEEGDTWHLRPRKNEMEYNMVNCLLMLMHLLCLLAILFRRRPSCNVVHCFGKLAAPYRCRKGSGVVVLGRGERVRDVGDVGVVNGAEDLRSERGQSAKVLNEVETVLQSSRRYRGQRHLLVRVPRRT